MIVNKITKCRICGNSDLRTVVDLGVQVLSGRFPKMYTSDPPSAPLALVQCTGWGCCGLVQLSVDIPMDEMYGPGYGYLSGLNTMMRNHLQGLASYAESLVHLESGDVVLDIGSNDGTLLRSYQTQGIRRVGMDGSHFQEHYTADDGIVFVPCFFSGSMYPFMVKPKIITSIAMFYDLPDPNVFVSDIKRLLHPDGVWVLEQCYLPFMIDRMAFDAICHEHLEYYGLHQIVWLCDRHGLEVVDVRFNDVNGGSFQLVVRHKGYDFDGFNQRIKKTKEGLLLFLRELKSQGKTVHVYGASTKGNVLLQYFGIDTGLVDYAADKNPSKWGCWTPGTHIPIVSEEESRCMKPDYYLVLPWHFRDGFVVQLRSFLDGGGRLIFPLPVLEVVGEDGVIVIE